MRHGFLLIDKPTGPTSHDIVARLRRSLHEPKMGHLGTLDPLASGLMVIAVGSKALKVVELFVKLPKVYEAEITFGAESTTYDSEGMITERKPKPGWLPPEDFARIQALIDDNFLGKIQQIPPAFSAVHVGGERAYRKAMRGENVEMKARETTISVCRILEYAYPTLKLEVHCDSGTYIRSLAHDLGLTMRCGGYLSALRRLAVGEWSVKNAVELDAASWTDILPLKDILASFVGKEVTDAEMKEISHGRPISGDMNPEVPYIAWHAGLPVALLERARREEGMLKPRKVL